MSKFFLLMVCILACLLVLACGAPTNRNAEATTNRNDNSAPAGDKVGIAECDNFITAYETCVAGKVPESARPSLKAAVATWRTDWKKMADDPQTRGALAAACQRQREATMVAMKTYNCAW